MRDTRYMLTLDGKPVVISWNSKGTPFYCLVGQTVFPVRLFKTLRTVERHAKRASAQPLPSGTRKDAHYGYVIVEVDT